MVLALLLLLATQAVLGLFSNDEIATTGLLARYQRRSSIKLMSRHRLIGDLLLIMVGVHIAAVLFHLFVKKENLVRAMFSGRSGIAARARPRGRSLSRKASMPLGFILLSIAIAAVAIAVNWPALFKS